MQIDLNHIHHWMQAIRQSADPIRTMDAFWSGQIKSKEWLIDALTLTQPFTEPVTIDIHGGWVGVLASMLFQSGIPIKHIRSIDIDPTCENIANEMNRLEVIDGRFEAVTADMCTLTSASDIVINTSAEHITQAEYDEWLLKVSPDSLIVVQSNNFFDCDEHINCKNSLQEFNDSSGLTVNFANELVLAKYTRYMVIGKKH